VGGGVSRHCDGFLMESGLCSKRMGWSCCVTVSLRERKQVVLYQQCV
jgi:hypothetical protein